MEPPAPVTTWLDDFDTEDEDTVELLRNLKDNDEDLRHLHLVGDGELCSNNQYLLGNNRENHWLACFLSRSTQLRSFRLWWMGQDKVSSESSNFLIEGMNCLTTIERFQLDLDSTMGLDSHEEMFDRLQPFFGNNPIRTLALEGFEFYEDDCHWSLVEFDVKKEMNFICGLEAAIKATNLERLIISSHSNFSIRGAMKILKLCESCPSIRELQLSIGDEVHSQKVRLPGRQLEYAVPALLKLGRLSNLQTLYLDGDGMGRDELIELLDVLPDNNTLKELYLISIDDGACKVDDDIAERLCNSMGRNRTLERLSIQMNLNKFTSAGMTSLKQLLCNTDSVDKTFESNHSLIEVGGRWHMARVPFPVAEILRPLYEINERFKRNDAAILKILTYHKFIDMRPLFDWEYRLLPQVVDCIHRAMNAVFFDASDQSTAALKKIEETKLTSLYQFVRELPDLYINSVLGLTEKPKGSAGSSSKRLKVS
ncbi:hypothetical protein THAOC_36383 [Thalassiosira oceanica]|uniref:Uncharacterized protein n=1 Tax=Thalassiosira oceanica TaxID=159749 RepID=K0QZF8_THAOC|nr:hypothetical protein THAOC_36383 [Thalassiosira oceanica]|eukprot:EJK45028.1 hypothetical protein THAOC_36383 [Thalassiosira oceanica]